MGIAEDLRAASQLICAQARLAAYPGFEDTLQRLTDAAESVGLTWCGSWLPGFVNLYLAPRAGSGPQRSGRCTEVPPHDVRELIYERAGWPDITELLAHARKTARVFEYAQLDSLGLMAAAVCERGHDPVLARLLKELGELRLIDAGDLIRVARPTVTHCGTDGGSERVTQDAPPHIAELAVMQALRSPLLCLEALARLVRRAADHLETSTPADSDAMPLLAPWSTRPDAEHEHERLVRGAHAACAWAANAKTSKAHVGNQH